MVSNVLIVLNYAKCLYATLRLYGGRRRYNVDRFAYHIILIVNKNVLQLSLDVFY